MAFLTQTQQSGRPGAIAGVIAIHAALGFVLVSGLGTAIAERIENERIIAKNVPTKPLPPPPPPPSPDPATELPKVAPKPYIPPNPGIVPPTGPKIDSSSKPDFSVVIPFVVPKVTPSTGTGPIIKPLPSVDIVEAVGAKPRNDATRWVTTSDYRSRWIREEMTGVVAYRVGIGTDGGVDNCSVTRSSGHAQLDEATCKLVSHRAKFDPARNTKDQKVTGSYSGSVLWQLPE